MIGWAGALQGPWAQRGFRRFGVDVVGVGVVVGAGVVSDGLVDAGVDSAFADDSTLTTGSDVLVGGAGCACGGAVAGVASLMVAASVGELSLRDGTMISRIDVGCRASELMVSERWSWRPWSWMPTSEGRLAEADRKSSTSEIELDGSTVRGMAVNRTWSVSSRIACLGRCFNLFQLGEKVDAV